MKPFPKSLNPDTLQQWADSHRSLQQYDRYIELCRLAGLSPTGNGDRKASIMQFMRVQRRAFVRWVNNNNLFAGYHFTDIRVTKRSGEITDTGFTLEVSYWLRKSPKDFVSPLMKDRFNKFGLYSPHAVHTLKITPALYVYATNPFLKKSGNWHLTYRLECPMPSDSNVEEILTMWESVTSANRIKTTYRNI